MRDTIPGPLDGERIDRVVSLLCEVSRSEASELVASGAVLVGNVPVTTRSTRVAAGDVIEIERPERRPAAELMPDPAVEFGVVHADADIVVVDKPAGLVVHPGAGNEHGTLVHGLLARHPDVAEVGEPGRPGIVHRLDKDTSGLLVVARTAAAHAALVDQLAARQATRQYQALVWGAPAAAKGMIDAPIGRSAVSPTRMTVATGGRQARTRYEVVRSFHRPVEVALLRCDLETGRTHQLRVHLAAIHHPVVGDATYGGYRQSFPVPRLFLHASRLAFVHPASGRTVSFVSPLPADLTEVVSRLS
ncbi:MAG: RluA family pseudouridine synthase [Acidimicrobiales bacterium]